MKHTLSALQCRGMKRNIKTGHFNEVINLNLHLNAKYNTEYRTKQGVPGNGLKK